LLRARLEAGPPNQRLGLVQAQHIFGRRGTDPRLVRGGLVRVRIPGNLIRLGEEGWPTARFPDRWWMERMRDAGIPFKAVVELSPRSTLEQHAAHAERLVRYVSPDVVIIGNEQNVVDRRPGVDAAAEIGQYLDRYEVMRAAIRVVAPQTRIQLYGEAYYGEPTDPDAFLRQVLAAMRQRALPPPDLAGLHVYDRAEVIPARVAGYRRLFAASGLAPLLSVEEVGPRMGVLDHLEADILARREAHEPEQYPSRLAELHAAGWLTEDEHVELVAQHLATAAASADHAQVFCAVDFLAELHSRRGLVSYERGRVRPALHAFHFMQRLMNDADVRLVPSSEHPGVATVLLQRRDGHQAAIKWSVPVGGEPLAGPRPLAVPPYTFVCDARGQLVAPPQPFVQRLELPGATTPEAAGAVRILL
jgi:hypothetical protein